MVFPIIIALILHKKLTEIFKTHTPKKGIISSLEVENLFTNVPVLVTIDMIINNNYPHPTLPTTQRSTPLKINFNTLRKIHSLVITEVTLYNAHGNIYTQKDGIAMGQFWNLFSVKFTCQTLKIRFLIPLINLIFVSDKLAKYSFSLLALWKST